MSTGHQKDWQRFYQAALLELDSTKLPDRIEQAYNAIQLYIQVASHNSDTAERQALADALANLRVLRREVGVPMNGANPKESSPSSC